MRNLPFDLLGRQDVEGGILLFFSCRSCTGEPTLFLRAGDPLTGRYPIACACGLQINFYFGSPLVGKLLIRSLPDTPPGARPEACWN